MPGPEILVAIAESRLGVLPHILKRHSIMQSVNFRRIARKIIKINMNKHIIGANKIVQSTTPNTMNNDLINEITKLSKGTHLARYSFG